MKRNTLGDTIRELRKRAHMTQEDLADGICSAVSISRIENGVQMPSGNTLDAILQKLGSSTYQICDIYYKTDRQYFFEEQLNQIGQLIQAGDFHQAISAFKKLSLCEDDSPICRQTYLMMEGIFELQYYNHPETALDKLMEGIKITRKNIDLDDFRNILFTEQEANILNILLACYMKLGRISRAVLLGKELVLSLKKQESSLKEFQVMKINALINLSQCMMENHELEEALVYIKEAENISVLGVEQVLLPEIMYIKARILYDSNQTEECKNILFATVPYMELIGKVDFAKTARDFVLNNFSEEIPSYIS